MNINIKKSILETIINEYNQDNVNQELELIYKKNIEENVLLKIIQFILKKYNKLNNTTLKLNDLKSENILDIYIDNISKNHRLTIKSEDINILKTHCINEKKHLKSHNFPENYLLEYKELISRYNIDDLNCKINLKKEYIENDEQLKYDYYENYDKFNKYYRYKKRYSIEFEDYKIDISIIKDCNGYNLLLSDIQNEIEHYEIEIEILNKEIELKLILEILEEYFILFKQIDNDGYFITNEMEKKTILKNYNKLINPNKTIYNKNTNIGPKPITLTKKTIKNMLLSSELTEKIEENYNNLYYKITEKADGERYFMYINNIGEIYLINDNNNIILTGLKLDLNKENHKKYINSILDGEYLYYKNEENKYIYTYKYFDIYILNNEKVYNKLLNNRILIMNELNLILKNEILKYLNDKIFINCSQKNYYDINEIEELQRKKYPYHIDGFIFMPTISLYNINNITFKEILKYKPIEENTMDVYINDNILYCGYNILLNKNRIYILSEILSMKPYILDFHKPEFIYDNKDNKINWNKLNKKVIEIRYDNKKNKIIFNKIRYDKTIKYNKTKQITANNFSIINDIIYYNYNPLTINDILNLSVDNIKKLDELNNINNYYKINNEQTKKNDIRYINNLIKRELINNSLNILEFLQTQLDNFNKIKVLDLACGRGGDLKKFLDTNYNNNILKIKGGVDFILGIDYDPINIEFYDEKTPNNNNARARYMSYKNTLLHLNNNENIANIYKNNNVYYISGDINLYTNDEISIKEIYYKLINKKYTDFPDRNIYEKKLLDDIQKKHLSEFDLYDIEQFESFTMLNPYDPKWDRFMIVPVCTVGHRSGMYARELIKRGWTKRYINEDGTT